MLINKLKQISSGQFIRNVGWLGGAELTNRVFRLATTVVLARMFSPQDYGLMAVVYTTYDFATVFTLKGGIGAKIIQADEKDVKTICDTSYWLNWILCGSIFIILCITAFPIAQFYGNNQLILPLCTIASVYLMFPLFMVNSAIIERENRLKITALCNATQSLLSNTIIVILALIGMGIWAIVWAMVLTTPVWIVISWMNSKWRPPKSFNLERARDIISFGGNLLGVELLTKLRSNLDYLLIGKFIGIEALGVYYFAFNAGLGISLNVINAFTSAVFPYFCEVRENLGELKIRYLSTLKKTYTIVAPIILIQSSLAPFYVPIIFGQQWVSAIPILIIICLSALMFPLIVNTYQLLNALGKTNITLYCNLIYTGIFAACLLVSVHSGILAVAITVFICQALILPLFSVGTVRYLQLKFAF
ncbi:MAG: lipopolysaccharide biosynthesis protein [Symplocastrum torsivum CPER-KK1]|jgi:PST family polysaccharide transporter|uniref:Lipopolysaccharide biosynthesis protein n=1 Tax=Symplocastrum torsivum CPER-KK1 TaxID=450513 RepID=A0A951UC96_9CYAN|nr:lipopolysaccharide biosynthesis protein [Symplocastrum torsivum CPER-KK1]